MKIFDIADMRVVCGTRLLTIEIGQAYRVISLTELEQLQAALESGRKMLVKSLEKKPQP